MLGASEKAAEKFSKEWYNSKRRETAEVWKQRQEIHDGGIISVSELRAQVAEAVKARRTRKAKTRTNRQYAMTRRQLARIGASRAHRLGPAAETTAVAAEPDPAAPAPPWVLGRGRATLPCYSRNCTFRPRHRMVWLQRP